MVQSETYVPAQPQGGQTSPQLQARVASGQLWYHDRQFVTIYEIVETYCRPTIAQLIILKVYYRASFYKEAKPRYHILHAMSSYLLFAEEFSNIHFSLYLQQLRIQGGFYLRACCRGLLKSKLIRFVIVPSGTNIMQNITQ